MRKKAKSPESELSSLARAERNTLMRYMDVNGIAHRESREWIACFEREYTDADGTPCMDVYIAAE